MSTPESKVKRKISQALKDAKVWYFLPVAGRFGKAGVPDFVGCKGDKFFAIEAKANGGQLTLLQAETISEIRRQGSMVWLIDETNVDRLPAMLGEF